MSLKECYDKMGADYEDVLSRLRSEVVSYRITCNNGNQRTLRNP